MNDQKIYAIKNWRIILGKDECPSAYGLTESKAFIENKSNMGFFEVIFSEAQFGRFVLAAHTECNGSYHSATDGWSRDGYRPSFQYSSPETFTPLPKILDFTA